MAGCSFPKISAGQRPSDVISALNAPHLPCSPPLLPSHQACKRRAHIKGIFETACNVILSGDVSYVVESCLVYYLLSTFPSRLMSVLSSLHLLLAPFLLLNF
jgi:hypothetical protein